MKGVLIVCPGCRERFDISKGDNAASMEELIRMASVFGTAWDLAYEYVEAFRANHYGILLLKKRIRLLLEIEGMWTSCVFEHGGKRYRTDQAGIREALGTVCNADKVGFKNHNYLKRVLMDSSQRVSAEGMTAAEERRRTEGKGLRTETGKDRDPELMTFQDYQQGKQ